MPQFLATRVDITPSNPDAWNDVDLSSYIAAGSSGVIVHIRNASASTRRNVGWRKKGSTDNAIDIRLQKSHSYAYCGVDANRIMQLYIGASTDITYTLVGYFTSTEATFFTNSILVSGGASATPTTFVPYDITSHIGADLAFGVMLEVVTSGNDAVGLRRFGSTVDLSQNTSQHGGFIIGVNSNKFEAKLVDASNTIYLNGYIKNNAIFHTNPLVVSATPNANIGTFGDLTSVPAGSLGGIYSIRRATSVLRLYAIRKKGTSTDIYYNNPYYSSAVIDCDANGGVEAKTETADDIIYQLGYFTSASITNITVDVPITQIDISALVETITTGVTISDPVAIINIESLVAAVNTVVLLDVDSTTINIESLIPDISTEVLVVDETATINIDGLVPEILTEVLVVDEIANIDNIEGLIPDIICEVNLPTDITTINLSGLEHVILTNQNLSSDIATINIEGLTNEIFGDATIDCDVGLINVEGFADHYVGYVLVEPDITTVLVSGLDSLVVLDVIAEPDTTQITIDGLIPVLTAGADIEVVQDSAGLINIDADIPLVVLIGIVIVTPLFPSVYLLPQIPTIHTSHLMQPDTPTINIQGLDGEFRVDNDIVVDTLLPIDISALIATIKLDDLYIYPPVTQIDLSALIPTLLTNLISPENFSAYLSVLKRVVVLEAY